MKKTIALVIAITIITFIFAGCGEGESLPTTKATQSSSMSTEEQVATASGREAKIMESANEFITKVNMPGKVIDKGDSLYVIIVMPIAFTSSQISTTAQKLKTREAVGWDGLYEAMLTYDNSLSILSEGTRFKKVSVAMLDPKMEKVYLSVENGEKTNDILE